MEALVEEYESARPSRREVEGGIGRTNMLQLMAQYYLRQYSVFKYAKLILPHVGLVALTVLYTLIGASIFYSIERPNEYATKRAQLDVIYERQDDFLELMWTLAHDRAVDQYDWKVTGREQMQNISDELFKAFEKVFLTASEVRRNDTVEIWSFSTAIFFAVTVVSLAIVASAVR